MSDVVKRIRERIEDLLHQVSTLVATRRTNDFGYENVDSHLYIKWCLSAQTVIKALAPNSHFEIEFMEVDEQRLGDSFSRLMQKAAILEALKEDHDGGYLLNIRGMLRAEVFGELIEQAEHLHKEGYHLASAVISGAVLEEHLRRLCAKHAAIVLPAKPKLDTMNAELVKAGEYNLLQQKEITLWAGIRNSAAHGRGDEINRENSEVLFRGVLRFVNQFHS